MKDEIIMYDSHDAAQQVTVTLWKSSKGKLWGDESAARYDGCTHRPCQTCGKPAEKGWTACDECRWKTKVQRYKELPFEDWDGVTPLYDQRSDQYFFHADDIEFFIEEAIEGDPDFDPNNMMLVFCLGNYPRPVSIDYWEDSMPEDGDSHNFEKDVIEKLDELNAMLRKHKPLSYSPGKIRTNYDYKPDNIEQ